MAFSVGGSGAVVRLIEKLVNARARKKAERELKELIDELRPTPTVFRVVTPEVAAGAQLGVDRGVLVAMHHFGERHVRLAHFAD